MKKSIPALKGGGGTSSSITEINPKLVELGWTVGPPFVGFSMVPIAGGIMHQIFGPSLFWSAVGILSTFGLSLIAMATARGGRLRRWVRTINTLYVGMWLSVAISTYEVDSVADLFSGMMSQIAIAATVILGTVNVLLAGKHANDAEEDDFVRNFARVKEEWGLGKTRIKKLANDTENKFKRTYEITVDRMRHTGRSVANADFIARLATLNETRATNIVPEIDPFDEGKVRLKYVDADLENQVLRWPGPSAPGKGPDVPVVFGRRIDGELARMEMLEYHTQVMGMTGSGKSFSFTWGLIAELVTRRSRGGRVEIWGIDISKGKQTFGDCEQALDRIAYSPTEAIDMILDLHKSIKERGTILQREGFRTWHPDSSLRYRVVIIEEAPDLYNLLKDPYELGSKYASIDTMEKLNQIYKLARSAGVHMISSLQRAVHSEQPTSVTRAIGNRVCFGVQSEADAHYGLSSRLIDMGAQPERWLNSRKGMCYMDVNGIPERERNTPVRMYMIEPDEMLLHCEKYPAPGKENYVTRNLLKAKGILPKERIPPNELDKLYYQWIKENGAQPEVEIGLIPSDPNEMLELEEMEETKKEIEEISRTMKIDGSEIEEIMKKFDEMEKEDMKEEISLDTEIVIPDEEDSIALPDIDHEEPPFSTRALHYLLQWRDARGDVEFKVSDLTRAAGPASRQNASKTLKSLAEKGYVTESRRYGYYKIDPSIEEVRESVTNQMKPYLDK